MLTQVVQKKERLVIGLMSGTSADGIDAALVKIQQQGPNASLTLVDYDTLKFSPQVRARIQACQGATGGTNREVTLLDAYLGELFAHAVLHICKKAGVAPEAVDLVGSHGQTLYHHPEPVSMPGFAVRGSRQIGNPAVIAERTGIAVISDFRSRDMAAGGQGAPLVPYLDWVLYHHRSRGRMALNIGGIANITALPAGCTLDGVTAFDTGPGNCLVDMAMAHYTQGKNTYDVDGSWGAAGNVDEALLLLLLEHPYLKRTPPKSVDKDEFGKAFFQQVLAQRPGIAPSDLVATLTAFTVRSVVSGVLEHLMQKERYEELIVSGGGTKNPVMMRGLEKGLSKMMVTAADEYGIPGKAKEAVLMAFLANDTVTGRFGNIPSATGASRPVVLGSITPGLRSFEDE